jgi:hypothetical protein
MTTKAFLENEPLIHAAPTLEMLSPEFLEKPQGAIYYGTGLATPKAPSVGLPFDVLVLVLAAEKLRRHFGLTTIHHHIADTHALTNPFCTPEGVSKLATEYREVLARIAKVTGIKLQVHLSSEFDQTSEYRSLLAKVQTDKNEYVKRELADMLWYNTKHEVSLKLGWLLQSGEAELGFDERLYDREFKKESLGNLSFGYVVAGRTFDKQRMKASPYIAIPGETRILLKPDTNVRETYQKAQAAWPDKTLGGALKHLNNIVRLWERLTETQISRDGDVLDRVQAIINRIFE